MLELYPTTEGSLILRLKTNGPPASQTSSASFRQSIAVNLTAFEGEGNGQKVFIGSKTETALLVLAKDHLRMGAVAEERANTEVVQLIPFDSDRKCMGAVISLQSGGFRLVVKGSAELMLAKASHVVSQLYSQDFEDEVLSKEPKEDISATINAYAERSLRTIAFLTKTSLTGHLLGPANWKTRIWLTSTTSSTTCLGLALSVSRILFDHVVVDDLYTISEVCGRWRAAHRWRAVWPLASCIPLASCVVVGELYIVSELCDSW